MDIEVTRDEDGEVTGLQIDGTAFESDDDTAWNVPKACLREVPTSSLPDDVEVECCDSIEEGVELQSPWL